VEHIDVSSLVGKMNAQLPTKSTRIIIGVMLLLIGSSLVVYTFQQLEPFILLLSLVWALFSRKMSLELESMFLTLCMLVFVYGVSLIYTSLEFHDVIVGRSDEWLFYSLSIEEKYRDMDMSKLLLGIINAPLAIKIWGGVYSLAENVGLKIGPWIGIYVNIFSVSISAYFFMKITCLLFPEDKVKQELMLYLCVFNGIFWLFGTLHLRDCFLLLINTIIIYSFIGYLSKREQLWKLLLTIGVYILLIPFLRVKLLFIPILFVSLLFLVKVPKFRGRHIAAMTVLMVVLFAGSHFSGVLSQILELLDKQSSSYSDLAEATNDNSLAMKLIISQPVPIRAPLGFVYQHLSPMPVWVGMYVGASPYHWYKSINGVMFLLLMPVAFVSIKRCLLSYFDKTSFMGEAHRFVIISYLIIFLIVAITSLEVRHIGQFLVLFFSSFLISYKTQRSIIESFFIKLFGVGLLLIYFTWIVLRFIS
jgi:hypothetical protein